MGWLFAQVWILCVVAFLAGAAVTWLVFVVPLRGRPAYGPAHPPVPVWAATHRPRQKEPPPAPPKEPPPPPVDPALSALDTGGIPRISTGTAATNALDELGAPGGERDKPDEDSSRTP
jgi:hypothetical protein